MVSQAQLKSGYRYDMHQSVCLKAPLRTSWGRVNSHNQAKQEHFSTLMASCKPSHDLMYPRSRDACSAEDNKKSLHAPQRVPIPHTTACVNLIL